jgi:hypothetical protein
MWMMNHLIVIYQERPWMYLSDIDKERTKKYKEEHPNLKIIICDNHQIKEVKFSEVELQN